MFERYRDVNGQPYPNLWRLELITRQFDWAEIEVQPAHPETPFLFRNHVFGALTLEPAAPPGQKMGLSPNPGGAETRRPDDELGTAIVTGDFNGDGFDEVVVGAPGRNAGRGAILVTDNRTVYSPSEPGPRITASSMVG